MSSETFSSSQDRLYCTCKRSNCLKKYCVCFTAGLDCDPEKCRCLNCKDTTKTYSKVAQRPSHHVYYTPVKKHKKPVQPLVLSITPSAKRPCRTEKLPYGEEEQCHEWKHGEEEKEEKGEEEPPLKDLTKDAVFSYIDNFFTDSTIDEYQPYS